MKTNTGFTLIELSIVLIIISLIVGGIVGGKSLIRSAELQTISSDLARFRTSLNTFQDQYDALPGDMRNAQDYWGVGAYNGDANNRWDDINEIIGSWHQMSLAGTIDESYSGNIPNGKLVAGFNVPKSDLKSGAFTVWYDADEFPGGDYNHIRLGAFNNTAYYSAGIVKAAEAKSIDKKIDDGKSNEGKVVATYSFDSTGTPVFGCISGGNYNLSNTEANCRLRFSVD